MVDWTVGTRPEWSCVKDVLGRPVLLLKWPQNGAAIALGSHRVGVDVTFAEQRAMCVRAPCIQTQATYACYTYVASAEERSHQRYLSRALLYTRQRGTGAAQVAGCLVYSLHFATETLFALGYLPTTARLLWGLHPSFCMRGRRLCSVLRLARCLRVLVFT